MIEVLYEDHDLIAVNKANGVLIHPSYYARDVKSGFLVEELSKQLGYKVYPIHRLDRKTSGIVLFAKSKNHIAQYQKLFTENRISKKYQALVRGHLHQEKIIDLAISDSKGVKKDALSVLKPINNYIIPVSIGKFPESWFAHIQLEPQTGRFHQLRKHCNKNATPIIGDYKHGDRVYNQYFKEHLAEERMFLHAFEIEFEHPLVLKKIKIECPLPQFWEHSIQKLKLL